MGDRDDKYILIASSQPSLRNGLKLLLDEENGLLVVATVADSHELIKKTESTLPDIVLLDWGLHERATPILVETISALKHLSAIIVLSIDADNRSASIEAGADAFVDGSDAPMGNCCGSIAQDLHLRRPREHEHVVRHCAESITPLLLPQAKDEPPVRPLSENGDQAFEEFDIGRPERA